MYEVAFCGRGRRDWRVWEAGLAAWLAGGGGGIGGRER